jgi:hypothetical protein
MKQFGFPKPYIVEVATFEDESTLEYTDSAILRFSGSSLGRPEGEFGSRKRGRNRVWFNICLELKLGYILGYLIITILHIIITHICQLHE